MEKQLIFKVRLIETRRGYPLANRKSRVNQGDLRWVISQ